MSTVVYKAYKYRIYPNKEQQTLIAKTIGCSRYIYNYLLNLWNNTYKDTGKGLNYYACSKELPILKKQFDWLKEVDSTALQSSTRDLTDGFGRFFKKQTNKPRFKSKKNSVQSYTSTNNNDSIRVEGDRVRIPKLGFVKFANSRRLTGVIKSATVRRNATGKYFISIIVETTVEELPKTNTTIGIDVGLTDFLTLSDGTNVSNPRNFRGLEKKLAKEQRKLARRKHQALEDKKPLLEAKNYQKQKIKVARVHEKISNKRKDFLQKLSTNLIKSHDVIGMEDLDIEGMLKNSNLSKSISDVSWSEFRRMLEYKAEWYGKELVVVDRFFPSSQLCSSCGEQNVGIKELSVRYWSCGSCGVGHDRDVNAATNIENEVKRMVTVGSTGLA